MSLNDDQRDYVKSMSKLPPDELCDCGWYRVTECSCDDAKKYDEARRGRNRTLIHLRKARDEIEQLQKKFAIEEADHLNTIDQRDRAGEAADKLAGAVGRFFNVDVGEHSNLNCPWEQAYEAIPDSETTKDDERLPGELAEHYAT